MKKNEQIVGALLKFANARKKSLETQFANALTPDQKALLLASESTAVDDLIAAIEGLTDESEEVTALKKMVEDLKTSLAENQTEMENKIRAFGNSRKNEGKVLRILQNKLSKGEFKNLVDLSAYTPEAEIDYVGTFRPVVGVKAGFEVSSTNKSAVKVRKLTQSGKAAAVAVHGVKPVIEFTGAQSIVNKTKLAGIVTGIADEDIWEDGQLEQDLQNEAMAALDSTENAALITLLETGAAFSNPFGVAVADADTRRALMALIVKVKQNVGTALNGSKIALAMNSAQWALLDDLRNANDTPISSDIITNSVIRIEDDSITDDKVYAWAVNMAKFKVYKPAFSKLYDSGVRVTKATDSETSITYVSDVFTAWQKNEQDLLVEEAVIVYLRDTTACVKGTIAGIKTALASA